MYCCVESCKATQSKVRLGLKQMRLFTFPKNPIKAKKWLEKVEEWNEKELVIANPRICTAHFCESDVNHGRKRTRLCLSAVPSKHEVVKNTCEIAKNTNKEYRQHRKPKGLKAVPSNRNTCNLSESTVKENRQHRKPQGRLSERYLFLDDKSEVSNASETDSDESWGREFNMPIRKVASISPGNENIRVCRFCNLPESPSIKLRKPANYLRKLYEDITKLEYSIDCPDLCCADCVRKINESSTFLSTLRRADELWRIENKSTNPELPEVTIKLETIFVDNDITEGNETVDGVMETLQASSSNSNLRRELKRHGQPWLNCPLAACSAIFAEARALKMHFYEKHKNDAHPLLRLSKRSVCFFCNLQFDTEETLHTHNEIHRILALQLKCSKCDATFPKVELRRAHYQHKHSGNHSS